MKIMMTKVPVEIFVIDQELTICFLPIVAIVLISMRMESVSRTRLDSIRSWDVIHGIEILR